MPPDSANQALKNPRRLDQVVNACKRKHLARSTAKTYTYWIRDFVMYQRRDMIYPHCQAQASKGVMGVRSPLAGRCKTLA